MRKFIAATIMLGLLSSIASERSLAGPGEDATAAYQRGDYATAVKLFRSLAAKSDVTAEGILGHMYYDGRGVPQDYKEAFKWFSLAVAHGYGEGRHFLGLMYYDGRGVPQDYKEAFKLLSATARQGDADSQYFIGRMYSVGNGVPQDLVRAHMWFNLAASNVPNYGKFRDLVEAKMTRAQVLEAQAMTRECQRSNYKQCP